MGSTSPLKATEHIQQLSMSDLNGKQPGFPSEELNTAQSSPQVIDARPGSRHENHQVHPIMRKTRSRTLAENKEMSVESRAVASGDGTNSAVPAIQMDTTLLSRSHDTPHSIAGVDSPEPNSPVGRSESRGASEAFGATLSLIGSPGFSTNRAGDGCLIQRKGSC